MIHTPFSHRFHFYKSFTAVLVAIAIPTFTTQLERSRQTTDLANVRGAYAELAAAVLEDGKNDHTVTVSMEHTSDSCLLSTTSVGGVAANDIITASTKSTVVLSYTASDGVMKINEHPVSNVYSVN